VLPRRGSEFNTIPVFAVSVRQSPYQLRVSSGSGGQMDSPETIFVLAL